jgi:hypothetical protein
MVDTVKPYAYLYDVIHDRLNKTLAKNQGKLIKMDFAKVPKGWDVDKWLYYISTNGIVVEDSFKEGNVGVATGKLAGALNNASSGVVDASLGTEIQQYITLLEWLSNQIGETMGISKQREGQISNRETVGGVERATLQSSHITESIFAKHDNLKKRAYEAFIETTKIAYKGRKKKFDYITSTGAKKFMEVDGDIFSECDFGLVVDNSQGTQLLTQKLDVLAQAGLQNQMFNFSTMMKLYSTDSISEKIRMMEAAEKHAEEMRQQQQQIEQQLQQQQIEAQAQQKQMEMEQKDLQNQRDNETKLLVAQIQAQANIDSSVARASGFTETPIQPISEKDRIELQQKIQEQKDKNKLEHEKLQLEREKIKSQERIAKSKNSG